MRVEAGAEEDVFERFRVLSVSGKETESRKSGEKAAAGGFEHGEQVKTRPGRRITHASGWLLPQLWKKNANKTQDPSPQLHLSANAIMANCFIFRDRFIIFTNKQKKSIIES